MNFFTWRYELWHGCGSTVAADAIDYARHDKRYHRNNFDPERMFCSLRNRCHHIEEEDLRGRNLTGGRPQASQKLDAEVEKVVAMYTNLDGTKKPGWMKTPTGKPSRLPKNLWILVRTKSFKKLFGDWENSLLAQEILAEDEVTALGILLQMRGKEQRKTAKEIYEAIRRRGPIAAPDGREVNFSSTGFKETKHHSADPHTLALIEILPEVISTMHYFGEGDVKESDVGIKSYHLYARKVNLGDGEMVARVVVREDPLGNFFYDEESTDFYSLKRIYEKETDGQTTREPNTGNDRQSPFAAHSLPEFFAEVKRGDGNLEKFGAENGEPTVSAIERFLNSQGRHEP